MNITRRKLLAGVATGTTLAAGLGYHRYVSLSHKLSHKKTAELAAASPAAGQWMDCEMPLPLVSEMARDSALDELLQPFAAETLQARVDVPLAPAGDADRLTARELEALSVSEKVRYFDRNFSDDVFLPESEWPLLESVNLRLDRAERLVGHGNFNVLGFDDLLRYAQSYDAVGAFTRPELDFVEKIFFTRASEYGFYGPKVNDNLTTAIPESRIFKVPYSGHYLFKDESLNYYQKLTRDVGPNVILTSGIRSNVKQLHLFLSKARVSQYNLSKASRSLAPPGHSFHGIGDFDVGRVDWGAENFTDRFAATDEFKRMQDLGYVQIRYTEDNHFGVRFEPWHIKVV